MSLPTLVAAVSNMLLANYWNLLKARDRKQILGISGLLEFSFANLGCCQVCFIASVEMSAAIDPQ